MVKVFTGRIIVVRLVMLTAMAALIGIGICAIYAAGNPDPSEATGRPDVAAGAWQKQLIFAIAGLGALVMVNLINYRRLGPASYWLYPAILVVLALVLLGKFFAIPFVPRINGTCRWLQPIPGYDIKVQPSEFCKLIYILALAWYLRFRSNYRHFKGLVGPFSLTLLAMVLILLEPDLGTVVLLMPILFAMLYVAGAKVKHLILILLLGVVVSPVLWLNMRPYQRMRVSAVLLQNDESWIFKLAMKHPKFADILAADRDKGLSGVENLKAWKANRGFQLEHSKYATASGGLWGYGFRKGPYITQNDKGSPYSLPEKHNDFIFAIIAHQWGFAGCLVVLGLYGVIVICGLEIAWRNTDPFARLITIGIIAMFAIAVIVNVSMTLGLMPITGLTLPFISYGGSSLMVSMMAIGLLNNIGRCRPFTVAGKGLENLEFIPPSLGI
ncbi:MAG: FtsW/RodA/SpoVE family cell cycle protein [Planctomycetes bacterium]|nr:FtsW/RodA/SpoVE family cell cycle protein [Planctomycetota bacterium]